MRKQFLSLIIGAVLLLALGLVGCSVPNNGGNGKGDQEVGVFGQSQFGNAVYGP